MPRRTPPSADGRGSARGQSHTLPDRPEKTVQPGRERRAHPETADPHAGARRLWGQLIVKVGRSRPEEE